MYFWQDKADDPLFHVLYICILSFGVSAICLGALYGFNRVFLNKYAVTIDAVVGEYREISSRGLTHVYYMNDYYCTVENEDRTKVYFSLNANDHIQKYDIGEKIFVQGERILSDGEIVEDYEDVTDLMHALLILIPDLTLCMTFIIEKLPSDKGQWRYQNNYRKALILMVYIMLPTVIFILSISYGKMWWVKYVTTGALVASIIFNRITI